MNTSFSGKVALVAGGTGGLGAAVSLAFLDEDARVIVTYRKEEEYAALQKTAARKAAALEGHAVDATDELATTDLVRGLLAQHGRLDAVVNTIGGYAGGIKLWELETKVLDRMFSLNLHSGFCFNDYVRQGACRCANWRNLPALIMLISTVWKPATRNLHRKKF